MQHQQIQRAGSARKPRLQKKAGRSELPRRTALARELLPNRRASETFRFEVGGLHYHATVSRFADGRIGEIFIGNHKVGSQSDTTARDAALAGKASTNASALVIETAITDNAQPFNQPWPPTGLGDGWYAVDKFSTRQRTFWRRIRLEYARQSPRARPIHR